MHLSIELLQNMLLITEIMSAVVALIMFSKWRGTNWRYFIYYLCFIGVAETACWLLRMNGAGSLLRNIYMYLIIPVEFIFYYWFFYQLMPGKRIRKLTVWATVIFVVALVLEAVVLNGPAIYFLPVSYTVGNIFLLVFIFIYLNHLMNATQATSMYYNLGFWFSLILIMFYVFTCPLYGTFYTLRRDWPVFFISYFKIALFLNMLMYLSFSIALIWSKVKSKPNSNSF
jgi:hypothetical protein